MLLKNIYLEKLDGKLLVTINNPDKMNCLNNETLIELEKVINYISSSDDVYGAIITGVGNEAFVSGADIEEFRNVNLENAQNFSLNGQRVFQSIEDSSKPIIAAVNGYALGGGCELAMSCHLRILSENAKIGLPEVKLGIIPGYGGTYRLKRLIGRSKALEFMLTGRLMDAKLASEIGFANYVINLESLIPYSLELLSEILKNSKVSIEQIIKCINLQENTDDSTMEAIHFKNCFKKNDCIEGVNAFLEKRKANF